MSIQLPDENDDMYSYFNKSVSAVQAHADHFEREYARPALKTSQAFFEERPIAATFVAIFVLLSFLPTAFFLGLTLFAVLSIGTLALSIVAVTSATVVLMFLSLLVLTLVITFVSAAFLTLFGISLYSFACLLSFVRNHGSAGVSEWMSFMTEFFIGSYSFQQDDYPPPPPGLPNGQDAEWSASEGPQEEVEPKHEEPDQTIVAGPAAQGPLVLGGDEKEDAS